MRKIEPQAVWCHQRPGLLDVLAQDLPQGRMQEVRGRMVLADRLSAWGIDVELHGHFVPHSAALDHAVVHNEAPSRYLRIGNLDLHTMLGSYGPTGVTDLSTRFAVEGRALEHQFDALPR